jgi:3-deoxy-D-manno-octulosonic-acid transferase
MAAIPVIRHCNEVKSDLTILMTTTTVSAFEVIKNQLPVGVLHQVCFDLYDDIFCEVL